MKAAIQHKNGDPTSPDVLSVVDDAAVPEPAAEQVLVKVSCASVNPIDYKLVAGDFPGKKAGPFGCDVSGTVAKLGPGCDAFKVGDRVYADAIKTPGSFAEYALVPAAASLNEMFLGMRPCPWPASPPSRRSRRTAS